MKNSSDDESDATKITALRTSLGSPGGQIYDDADQDENAEDTPTFSGADPTFLNHHAWALRWADSDRSRQMAEAVLQHSRAAGSFRAKGARRRNGLALRTLSWQATWRGALGEAEDLAYRAIARLKGAGAPSAMADVYSNLSMIENLRGRRDVAQEFIQKGFEYLEKQDNLSTRVDLLVSQGVLALFGKRIQVTQKSFDQALVMATGEDRARVEQVIGRGLLIDDRPGEAMEFAFRSIHLCKEHKNNVILPYALELAGAALVELGRIEQGQMLFNEAFNLAAKEERRIVECHLLLHFVRLNELKGKHDEALVLSQEGAKIAEVIGYHGYRVKFLKQVAQYQEAKGDIQGALESLKTLLSLREAEIG